MLCLCVYIKIKVIFIITYLIASAVQVINSFFIVMWRIFPLSTLKVFDGGFGCLELSAGRLIINIFLYDSTKVKLSVNLSNGCVIFNYFLLMWWNKNILYTSFHCCDMILTLQICILSV